MITKINIYRNRGEWCYAARTNEGHDHSDVIDVRDDASETEARVEVAKQFPAVEIKRVTDANEPN